MLLAPQDRKKGNNWSYRLSCAPQEVKDAWKKLKSGEDLGIGREEFMNSVRNVKKGDYSKVPVVVIKTKTKDASNFYI